MKEEKIIEEAKAYLTSGKTLADTASDLGISKRTLQLHLGKLESIDLNLYQLVLKRKEANQNAGRVIGGTNGKRGVSYTEEEALSMAKEIAFSHLTYEEAKFRFHTPSSTIYDMIHSDYVPDELQEQLRLNALENLKNSTIEAKEKSRK